MLNDKLNGYNIDALLNPFMELLKYPEHYSIVDMSRKGLLDFYTIKINESYNAVEGERDETHDKISNYYLSELGELKITVISTETYWRISSIDNLDDKTSPIIFEMYFSYAAPPISAINCAEEYVKSINNPGEEEKDMTLMYVIIGLACGLGIPLISVLIWFIVKKFRFFKDYDPEEMDIDDYIKIKKGIATEIEDANATDNLCESVNTENDIAVGDNATIENNLTKDEAVEPETALENTAQADKDLPKENNDVSLDTELDNSESDHDKEEL